MQPVNYNEISKIYDNVREGDVILINHFLQELPADDFLKILDIGCCTGNYTDLFQKVTQAKHYQVHCVELSEGMISKARKKNSQVIFQQATAEKIPSADNFFDFVYMPDIRKMFSEIYRILKPQKNSY